MPDGTEYRQIWPTSALDRLQHPALLEKDPEYLRRIVSRRWNGWHPRPGRLAPVEYGLVVVDLTRDVILDWQGAMNLRWVSIIYLARDTWMAADVTGIAPVPGERDSLLSFLRHPLGAGPDAIRLTPAGAAPEWYAATDSIGQRFALLYGAGRVPLIHAVGYDFTRVVPRGDLHQVLTATRALVADDLAPWLRYVLDLSPLHVETFDHGYAALPSLLARVRELGFRVSPAEEDVWSEWLSR